MFKHLSCIALALLLFMGCAAQNRHFETLPAGTITSNGSVDIRGKTITTFVLYKTYEKLKTMETGEIIELITDNYAPVENGIHAWSRMTGHKIVEVDRNDAYLRYYIEKGVPLKNDRKLAMVISDPGLEELLSPLGFALAGALSGIDVHLYFQGPAVKVLEKGFKAKLHGINSIFSGFAREGMAATGHIPPQEKLKQLKELGAHFYICGPSMDHFGTDRDNLIFDDVIQAEYFTFMEIMEKADIHIFLQ